PAGAAAVARGREVFAQVCRSCHGLRYLGERAPLAESDARAAFGKVPPDLSLMALARGREGQGAAYIAALLSAYVDAPEKNRVSPGIAMPAPFAGDDPDLRRKAADVAAYLLFAADPHAAERRRIGAGVLVYLAALAALLFLVNRRTWSGLRDRGGARGGDAPGA
ncbi:MAG TPA: cytochrome c1, partial [bacterium]